MFWAAYWMNDCQHKAEFMDVYEKAVSNNKTTELQTNGMGGGRGKPKKEKHRRGETLTLVFACFFFP